MNILSSIYRESAHFLEQSFLPTLTAQQKRISAIVLIALSGLAACYALYSYCSRNWKVSFSEDEEIIGPRKFSKRQKPSEPQNIPDIEDQARLNYQQGIRTFSCEVLQKEIGRSKINNLLISPLGISFLLSMIKHAVGLEDQAEIERIIHLPHDENELKVSAYEFIKKLMDNGFDIAGLLFLNPKYRLNPEYQKLASQYYQSKVESGSSADKINAWVKEVTNGQIEKIITQEDLIDFFVVLANAIHFKAQWIKPFEAKKTYFEDFEAPIGTVKVEMMHKTDQVGYYEDEHCQAIKLKYSHSDSFMLLVLPKKDNDFSFIDESRLNTIQQDLTTETVDISLPKFKLEQEVDVMKRLKEMGMNHLFNKPDFSPLVDMSHVPSKTALPNLCINQITQKSALVCDEEGTEASTVTVAIVEKESCMMPEKSTKEIYFNRPFLAILGIEQAPILCGVIRNPAI